MKTKLMLIFSLALTVAIFPASASAQTNLAITNSDAMANGYLQIQQQLHAARLAIEESRLLAADEAKKNADALTARLQMLEQTVAAQRSSEAETARKTQQLTLVLAGGIGLAGLGIMLLMVWFQWRALRQVAEISAQHQAQLLNAHAVHQLAAPGRATVEVSNARLLDVVGQLERKILELEGGSRLIAATPGAQSTAPLADGQKFLDANQPQQALEAFDHFLAAEPDHAEALVKKAAALERLGRLNEALACCDQAISKNRTFTPALLQKGGLLNKLHRHAEAIDCFEQALLAQEKKAKL